MKFTYILLIGCFALIGLQAQAITITQQGSGELSYLTNGNACWRACYMAVNEAKQRIENIASNHCAGGYSITAYPTCSWPASDPSFLDMKGNWPVCKCSDTCTGSFTCNNSGQFPSFFGNVAQQWRQVKVFTMQHNQEVKSSFNEMKNLTNPGALVQAVEASAIKYNHNTDLFYKSLELGKFEFIKAPQYNQLIKEFHVPLRYGIEPIKKPGQPIPIRPIKPGPKKPGHPIVDGPKCIKAACLN